MLLNRRKYYIIFSILFSIFIILTYLANKSIIESSQPFISDDLKRIKPAKTGLLLGTNPILKSGRKNDFFHFRIDAAVELYKAGKVKVLIISGDNSRENYNEPEQMKKALVKRGVPANVIYLDLAGLRTLDSVIRAREIFGQDSFIVISQRFHNERAVFIARKNDINAYGYNAKEVDAFKGFKTKVRELFARDKVFLDLILGVEPKFLGEKVRIP
jgi:SanA protein